MHVLYVYNQIPSALYYKVKPGGSKRLSNAFIALIWYPCLTWWRYNRYHYILVSITGDPESISGTLDVKREYTMHTGKPFQPVENFSTMSNESTG